MGFDAHAKTFLITKDGGYIAAGNGLSCECENFKSLGFVLRADVCKGLLLTFIGTLCIKKNRFFRPPTPFVQNHQSGETLQAKKNNA